MGVRIVKRTRTPVLIFIIVSVLFSLYDSIALESGNHKRFRLLLVEAFSSHQRPFGKLRTENFYKNHPTLSCDAAVTLSTLPVTTFNFHFFSKYRDEDERNEDTSDVPNESSVFYDDFGDFVIGNEESRLGQQPSAIDSDKDDMTAQLSSLVSKSREEEVRRDSRISKNWRTGNWKVRGFALDKYDPVKNDATSDVEDMAKDQNSFWGSSSSPRLIGDYGKDKIIRDNEFATDINSSNLDGPINEPSLSSPSLSGDAPASSSSLPIHISCIVLDQAASDGGEFEEVIAVGRTDGSVCLVQLGTEYLTRFTAVPKVVTEGSWDSGDTTNERLTEDNDDGMDSIKGSGDADANAPSVRIESELVRQDVLQDRMRQFMGNDISDMDQDRSGERNEYNIPEEVTTTPFEVLHQFQAHGHSEPITSLLFNDGILYTAGGSSGDIKVWKVSENDEQMKMIPLKNLCHAHTDKIVALKTLSISPGDNDDVSDHNLLLSVSIDGSFALWDTRGGDLVYKCQMEDDYSQPISINCADVDVSGKEHVIYLGLSSGHIVGYVASEVVGHASMGGSCPVPTCRFLAHDEKREGNIDDENDLLGDKDDLGNSGVTAIKCAGEGTLALEQNASRGFADKGPGTTLLLTGGADGKVKQWEMMTRKISAPNDSVSTTRSFLKLEHWPRLSTQRMKRRAHIFEGHFGSITALVSVGTSKILSSGADGTIRVWNPSKGEELYRMEGFTRSTKSLCLENDILITDGMEEYVCVHDFDVDDAELEDSYEVDW